MKKHMIKTLILRHFDQTCKTILETNSFNYVNDEVLFQYNNKKTLNLIVINKSSIKETLIKFLKIDINFF